MVVGGHRGSAMMAGLLLRCLLQPSMTAEAASVASPSAGGSRPAAMSVFGLSDVPAASMAAWAVPVASSLAGGSRLAAMCSPRAVAPGWHVRPRR